MPQHAARFQPIVGGHRESQDATSSAQKPSYLNAAESAALDEGRDALEILKEDSSSLESSTFPTSECLSPTEIEELFRNGTLQPSRLEHVKACDFCKLIVRDRV